MLPMPRANKNAPGLQEAGGVWTCEKGLPAGIVPAGRYRPRVMS